MRINQHIKKVAQNFLVIFASIIIVITALRQIYSPDMSFDLKSIYIIMAFSFMSSLVGFGLNASFGISEKNMRMRIAIHFLGLETILISLGAIFGIVTSVSDVFILALEIAVIYAIVRLLSWRNDKKAAEKINEGLQALRKNMKEDSEL